MGLVDSQMNFAQMRRDMKGVERLDAMAKDARNKGNAGLAFHLENMVADLRLHPEDAGEVAALTESMERVGKAGVSIIQPDPKLETKPHA